MKNLLFTITMLSLLSACQQTAQAPETAPTETVKVAAVDTQVPKDFAGYWYNGLAELNSYELDQVRYGDMHQGHAVLIFVTEDFSKSKQVKLDYSSGKGNDKVSVLKLNDTRKFLTGIYPYSIMKSVYTPVDLSKNPRTIKQSTSVQEWCGHVYSQLNLDGEQYRMQLNSYFESEGDTKTSMSAALLEDELFTRLRINPKSIPTGRVEVIPSSIASRLLHMPVMPQTAEISFGKAGDGFEGDVDQLTVQFIRSTRKLVIYYQADFPFQILGWDESQPSRRPGSQFMTSKARLKKSMRLDYWSRNNNRDRALREELGL